MLVDINKAIDTIKANKILFFAGDEEALKKLPKGKWIGGTIPYFMTESGGMQSKNKIFMNEMPDYISDVKISLYDEKTISNLTKSNYNNGFSMIIIPAKSNVHIEFSQNAPNYEGLYLNPLIGWISGVDLNDLGKISPKVINGETLEMSDKKAIAMNLKLPDKKTAEISIINLFKQGSGDTITFEEEGFVITNCLINGKNTVFSDYLNEKKIDIKLPLSANYCGAIVNVSFQSVADGKVSLIAPVFKGVEYKIAEPVINYVESFTKALADKKVVPAFTCNCILNYLYAELEGKKVGNLHGPITFGEIAYQLLNQTLVYLEIKDVK